MISAGIDGGYLISSPDGRAINYGGMQRTESLAAAHIYVHNFPHLVRTWFHDLNKAAIFFGDVFELIRTVNQETSFSASLNGELIGYMILINPGRRLLPAIINVALLQQFARHLITNQYGVSLSLLRKIFSVLVLSKQPEVDMVDLSKLPYIYVLAIDKSYTGMGIGSKLVDMAKRACEGTYEQIWLEVEQDNIRAINFYHQHGFRLISSNTNQSIMIWTEQDNC